MTMTTSSSWLSLPIQLLRYYAPSSSSSNRLGLGSVHRPSPHCARMHMQPAKGLKPVTATGRGDGGGVDAASPLRLLADEVAPELHAAAKRMVGGGALHSPKGRPGSPTEGSGGGKIRTTHAAAPTTTFARARGPTPPGLPAEGSGGNGGTKH